MKILFVFLLITISGCELITIGKQAKPVIDINQNSPVGAVYLFKTELDSNNITAASRILAEPDGKMKLAEEKYELYSEIARLKNTIFKKPVTGVTTDSLKPDIYNVNLELDYIKTICFTTQKIDSNWYIVKYKE